MAKLGIHHLKTDTLTNMLQSTNVHLSLKKLAGSLVQAKTFWERILMMVFGFRKESLIFPALFRGEMYSVI